MQPHSGVGFKRWVAAMRPRTLAMGLMPVVIAASIVWNYAPWGSAREKTTGYCTINTERASDSFYAQCNYDYLVRYWTLALLCLVVSLCLQIAVNYVNDYSDGIRDTDSSRIFDVPASNSHSTAAADGGAPVRLTASKKVDPSSVLFVAGIFAMVAVCAGIIVIFQTLNLWLLLVGALCLLGGWFYTGGKHPYGYAGLGEVAVFLFFGVVAVWGTVSVLDANIHHPLVIIAGIVTSGSYACVLMLVNNLRDAASDEAAGKRTLVVLIGPRWGVAVQGTFAFLGFAATLFAVLSMGLEAGVNLGWWWIAIGVVLLGLAIHSVLIVWNGQRGNFRKAFNLAGPAALIASLSYVLVSVLG